MSGIPHQISKLLKIVQSFWVYKVLFAKLNEDIIINQVDQDDLHLYSKHISTASRFPNNEIKNCRTYFIATTGNRYMGSVMLQNHHHGKKTEEYCLLYNMKVLVRYRNRGLGSMLVSSFIKAANEKGFKEVFLSTDKGNSIAINLYKKKGFEVVEFDKLKPEYKKEIKYYTREMSAMILKL